MPNVILSIIASSSYYTTLKLLATCVVGVGLLVVGFTGQSILASTNIELWYLHHSFLVSDEAVEQSKKLIDQAVAAGYTGVVFWDSSFSRMGNPDWPQTNENRLKEVIAYAHKRHLKTISEVANFGFSNDALLANPNWAEAQHVKGTRFQVAPDGRTLMLKNSPSALLNGNFRSGNAGWSTFSDPNFKIDPTAHMGSPAVTIVDPAGNARLRQKVSVQPERQYHLSVFYRTIGKQVNGSMVIVYDGSNLDKVRMVDYLRASDDWSYLDYLFNSGDSTEILVAMGVWGGSKGTFQFANAQLEETGLVWLAHRAGAPFKLYDPDNPSNVYAPGSDYNEVIDPGMQPGATFNRSFHTPPPFTLPASTSLKPGQIVAADYYAVTPYSAMKIVSLCLTEEGVFRWLGRNAQAVRKVTPPESGILLGYDEIRHADFCASCRAKNMTPGELLAWNFDETLGIYRQALPDSTFWVWNDMFDPYHNAKDHVGLVEGSFAGSWKGLPPEVGILNWNLDQLKDSLKWFSGQNPEQPVAHNQIIAGFYDRPNAAAEAAREIAQGAGIPGIRGVMYTTWNDDYSKMKAFADAARAAWPDYLKTVPAQ